jgi:hypothetical protein
MVFGQCKDMTIKFVNDTGLTVTIPSEGHRVKNPGGWEGWNNLTLGGSIDDLAPGASKSVRQTLNIKCVATRSSRFTTQPPGAATSRRCSRIETSRRTRTPS